MSHLCFYSQRFYHTDWRSNIRQYLEKDKNRQLRNIPNAEEGV